MSKLLYVFISVIKLLIFIIIKLTTSKLTGRSPIQLVLTDQFRCRIPNGCGDRQVSFEIIQSILYSW